MKTIIVGGIYAVIATVWVQTLVANLVILDDVMPLAMAAVAFGLFYILYFAEGLELAMADLRDKDAEQVADPRTRAVLAEMQAVAEFFFSQRQIFVVSIITFVSLTLDYEAIYFYPFGWVHDSTVTFLFGLSFVTLTVLWFCQVTPKRLAILNSELFLQQSLFVWPLVKLIGSLGLVAPVEVIVSVARKWFGYDVERRLAPSLDKTYTQTFHRYGVATDNISVEAEVQADGSVHLTRDCTLVCGHGDIEQFGGTMHRGLAGIGEIRSVSVEPMFIGVVDTGESLSDAYPILDSVSAPGADLVNHPGNMLADVPHETSVFLDGNNPGVASWSIRLGTALPRGLQANADDIGKVAVMVVRVKAVCGPGLLALGGQDYWTESFDLPTRTFSLSVVAGDASPLLPVTRSTSVGLGEISAPFPVEQKRVAASLASDLSDGRKVIAYPAQGAVYRTTIDFLQVRTTASDGVLPGDKASQRQLLPTS